MYKYLIQQEGQPPRYSRKFDVDSIEPGMIVFDLYQDTYLVFGEGWKDVKTPKE